METLDLLSYGSIAFLAILEIIFEIKEGHAGNRRTSQGKGYEYYTADGSVLRIVHVFGSRYKVYTSGYYCPVPNKKDRLGTYFNVKAGSSSEVEFIIDGIYRKEGG